MTKGVIYYNRGGKCIVRLIVSLMTIRRHFDGPITIFLEGKHPDHLVKNLMETFNANVVYRPDIEMETGTLVHKIEISMESPYDLSVWIDSDTVILGEFDELFEQAKNHDLVVPHFAGWMTTGRTIAGRIKRYKDFCPEYIDAAINYGPAINTGIYAWPKNSPMFKEWLRVAKWGDGKMFIADEVACQVLLPQFNCCIVGTKYNVSVLHDPNTQDPRIVHYHGRKHCKEAEKCSIWLSEFLTAVKYDICGIRQYIDSKYGDKRLNSFLKGKYKGAHEVIRSEILKVLKTQGVTLETKNDPMQDNVSTTSPIDIDLMTLNDTIPNQDTSDKTSPLILMEDFKKEPAMEVHGEDDFNTTISTPTPAGSDINNPFGPNDITIVTACDPKYVEHLKTTLPNWIKFKGVDRFPMIVYVNGFGRRRRDNRLDFLRKMPNVRLIGWNLEGAESQRENMLTAFVLGAARDVTTPYWVKIDADAFAVNDSPLVIEEMKAYAISGHKWNYSFAKLMPPLIEWANAHPAFAGTPKEEMDPARIDGRRYRHERVASYVMFHNSEFVKFAAELAGNRLPCPSHDTYLWYVAHRLHLPIKRHNFKRFRGMSNKSHLESLQKIVAQIGV